MLLGSLYPSLNLAFAETESWVSTPAITIKNKPLVINNQFPPNDWWTVFQDPFLNNYVNTALANNHEILSAISAVDEARALARMKRGQELPQIDANPGFSRQKFSENLLSGLAPGGNSSSTGTSGGSFNAPGRTLNFYSLPFSASYELDIFGKKRNRTQIAKLTTERQKELLKAAILRLSHQVIVTYRQIQLTDTILQSQGKTLEKLVQLKEINQLRVEHGLEPFDTFLTAQEAINNLKVQIAEQKNTKQTLTYQFATLLGQTPAQMKDLEVSPLTNQEPLNSIYLGNPDELFEHRPDIKNAELQLAQSNIDIKLAKKAYLPDIPLSGQFGWSSTNLDNWLDWKSNTASVAASLLQPLFTGGQRKANLKRAKAVKGQALNNYQQTLLNAFTDVEINLVSLNTASTKQRLLEQEADSINKRLELIKLRMKQGNQSILDWLPLSIEAEYLQQQISTQKVQQLISQADLYKALGGGL